MREIGHNWVENSIDKELFTLSSRKCHEDPLMKVTLEFKELMMCVEEDQEEELSENK